MLMAFGAGLVAAVHAHEAPTFTADVAPIVFARCTGCHRAGQMAPMPLTTFEEVRPWARAIQQKVVSRAMPPWLADSRFGRFRNDRALTPEEIRIITAWVDAGAPRGLDPMPPLPARTDGWSHPSGRLPDIVLDMPDAFPIPRDGVLPPFAIYSALPSELTDGDHFVEAVQLLPSDPSVVHHSAFSLRALPRGVRLGAGPAWRGGPDVNGVALLVDASPSGLSPRRPASAAEGFSSTGASHFVFYFPGNNGFAQFAGGTGKRIRREDFAEWSVHYTPSGRPARDRERVGFWLQRVPPTHEVVTMRIGDFHIVNGREVVLPAGIVTSPGHAAIVSVPTRCGERACAEDRSMIPPIPPGAANWKITAITPFQDDVTLYLAYPHGHLRLADMTYVLTYPDGREDTILSVPRFDFNWQLVYEWAMPLRVAAGSTIKAVAHYDNSASNRLNPDPAATVSWGEQTTDEMFNGYVDLSVDKMDVRLEREPAEGRRDLAPPRVPIVTAVGCVSNDSEGAVLLTHASTPRPSTIVHADASEVAQAQTTPLGAGRYELLGAAEFGSDDALLARGQRAAFTTRLTANATHALVTNHKILVKALLIADAARPRLNLLSVQETTERCPPR